MRKAVESFQQAIDQKPNFALAYTGLADSYALLGGPEAGGDMPPNDTLPKAKAAALKALALNESLAEPHVSLGHVLQFYDRDWAGAERHFKRAIELNPNYPLGHHFYAVHLSIVGRYSEALAEILRAVGVLVMASAQVTGQEKSMASPADGHTIHVTAPHVVAGKVMGPYHHYSNVLSSEPVIECLCYDSSDPGAGLQQVEYIVAKSITRAGAVTLANWNKNWHDHQQEISTGRVQVLDLPADKAKEVADLVATTDGIIFHLWSHDEKVPSGKVIIAQSVGHVNLTQSEFKKGAADKPAAKPSGK